MIICFYLIASHGGIKCCRNLRTKVATFFSFFEIMRAQKAASKVLLKDKKKTHTFWCAFSFWRNRTGQI